jgi:hypothetical protein
VVDIGRAALDIGARPGFRPFIVGFELGKVAPVAPGQFTGIPDALATLLRGIDEEHAAEALARQPPERAVLVTVEQQNGLVGIKQIERCGNAGNSATDDQDLAAIQPHPFPPPVTHALKGMIGTSNVSLPQQTPRIRPPARLDAVDPRCTTARTANNDMRQLGGMVNGGLTAGRAVTVADAGIAPILLVI